MNLFYVLLAYFSLFALGLIDNSRGPIYPEVLSFFKIKNSEGSLIFSLSSLFAFFITLCSKFWLNKLGVIFSTKLALFLMTISALSMGFFGSGQNQFIFFLLSNIIFGISVGLLSITLNLIISESVDIVQRQKSFSKLHSMYGLASFIAPLIMSFVYFFKLNWNEYFYILALFPLLLLLKTFKLPALILHEEKKVSITTNKVRNTQLGVMVSFYVATEMMISTRLVLYVNEVWKKSLAEASSLLSLFFFFLLLGRFIFSIKNFKTDSLKLLKLSASFTIFFLILGLYFSPIFFGICGLSMSYFFPCCINWVSIEFKEESRTLIPLIMTFVGGMIVFMHFGFGVLSDFYGIDKALFLGLFLMFTVLYLLHKQKKSLN